MNSNCTLKASLLIAITTIGALRAAPTETRSESETVKLFARESTINVLDRKANVAALTQSNEAQCYRPDDVNGFHVEVVNQLPVATSIHWHGLVLPKLMDEVTCDPQDH